MKFLNDAITKLVIRLKSRDDEEGQTLVEYGLIVALISIVAILGLNAIGASVNDVFNSVSGTLDTATAT